MLVFHGADPFARSWRRRRLDVGLLHRLLDPLLELTRRYSEPHRHYHGIEHIAFMLHLGRDLRLTDEQVLGIWFHDAVFDVHSSRNEEDSAALAAALLSAEGYPAGKIAVVERIVLDTKGHRPTIAPSELVVDLDLAPLSLPWDQFAEGNVVKKYSPSWDWAFRATAAV